MLDLIYSVMIGLFIALSIAYGLVSRAHVKTLQKD